MKGNLVFLNSGDQTGYNGVFVSETSNGAGSPAPAGSCPGRREETPSLREAAEISRRVRAAGPP